MLEIETLGILDQIQALVSDHMQVVSYKWLSRNFLVTSNTAKRLLQEFVEKNGNGLEVVYTLSGWLKSRPQSYEIRLVNGPKLAEAKQEFDSNCSIQVYSVQACIPNDPAALWNTEFVQAEELFKQPSALDNCLRDNRFCGISNSFVKRNAEGTPANNASVQPKSTVIPHPSKTSSAHENSKVQQQSSLKVDMLSSNAVKDIKGQNNVTGVHDQVSKLSADKEKSQPLPTSIKNKSSSGNGGSLTNLWGRASAKSKPYCVPGNASAEAQDCARDAAVNGSSEDDAEDVNFRRASNGEGNRKRKVVFDLSDEDEYEDAVNLASPDPPKRQSSVASEQIKEALVTGKPNLNFDKLKEDKPKVKEEKDYDHECNKSEEASVVSKRTTAPFTEKNRKCVPENDVNKDKVADSSPSSPKRRKVVKTRIDERGREVTEVFWEGEESEKKKADSETLQKADSMMKKAESDTVANHVKRPPAAKKSPALGSTAPSNTGNKAGNKKAGNQKDPKQGNILSFFKRV